MRAAGLAHWILVGFAGLAGTLAFTAARASRSGCAEAALTNLVAVAGVAGFVLAVGTLLLVAAIPRYRATGPALVALSALLLSTYAMITFLAHDNSTCF
jgi:xanthine/uracil/vitamin C permease (AzgA family)